MLWNADKCNTSAMASHVVDAFAAGGCKAWLLMERGEHCQHMINISYTCPPLPYMNNDPIKGATRVRLA